ncbi:MAG: hypothetical protein K2Q03_09815 [Sphingobacteriaceae bacterium]|nr:hypothetical protein [Sphingobacteriaceae bacterium]
MKSKFLMLKNILAFIVLSISTCFAANGGNLQYIYWNPLGNQLFNESRVVPVVKLKPQMISMLLNQSEPVSFILQNSGNEDIKVQSISVIDSVKSDNINYDFRVVKNWYMGSQTSIHPTKQELENPKLTPELLLKNDGLIFIDKKMQKNYVQITEFGVESYQDISSPTALMPNGAVINDTVDLQPFTITAQNGKQIWLNLKTNSLTDSGKYNRQIKINYTSSKHKHVLIVPLVFEVLSIALSDDKLNYSIYYSGQLRNVYRLLSTPKTETQYIAELKNLKSHGVLYPTQYLSSDNESTISKYIKIRNQLGFPCDKMYFLGGIGSTNILSVNQVESNIKILKSIVSSNTSCKNSKIFMYGIDEAVGVKLLSQKSAWGNVVNNNAYTYVASNSDKLTDNKMIDYLDTLVTANIKESIDLHSMRKLNKDVYLYGQPQSGIANPFIYRKNYGYFLIKDDYTGAMPFAYQFGFPGTSRIKDLSGGLCFTSEISYCSIWNNFDSSQYYDHMFTYPTTNGVIDTVQWEGYAAAITDTRYYYTLVDLMKTRCTLNDARCNFDPMSLIDVEDPGATREKIIEKIKLFINKD